MPKKGKKGKKAGKKSGSGKRKSAKSATPQLQNDPVAPEHIAPPQKPGEKLIKLLTTHKVDEKELYGFKVSTRVLQKLTPEEIRDLRIVFEAFDVHERGFMGPVELRKSLKALGFKVNREQVKKLIQDASVEGRAFLDFNEFLDVIIDQQGDSRDIYQEILQGFKMFDYDEEGKISMENLKLACREAGVKFSKQELQDMMEEADKNGDSFVDKDEFIKIMLQTNLF